MAAASIPLKHLEDVTKCPICSEIFVDTRVLPCIHTYCLRCITRLTDDMNPGDKVPCPLCRKEFAIPEAGISELPKNYFVEKLLEAKSLAYVMRHEDSLCDVCVDDEELSEMKQKHDKGVMVYCVDCRKNMCRKCYKYHQQFQLSGTNHRVIEHNKNPMPADDLLLKFPETSCDKHPDKFLEIYCLECKTAVCMMCYIKGHHSHKCSDVKEVADDLASQLVANAEGIQAKVEDCKSMLEKIADEERILTDEVEKTENDVNEEADKLKQLIDQHREEVLTKLSAAKSHQMKANETVKQELERQIVVMESFIRYSREVKEKGTAFDIARTADELHVRGEELLRFDVEVDLPIDYTSTEVKFEATLSDDDTKQLHVFGNLNLSVVTKDYAVDNFLKFAKLAQTIPNNGGAVTGIATLGDEVFVVRWNNPNIQVYKPDTNGVNIQRNVNVGSTSNAFRGLAACEFNQCLYVPEENNQCIHKVSPVTNSSVKQWSVGGQPYGISVNRDHNLLVACYNTHKVQEYTTDGAMVREINLQPGITNPVHVVQLQGGEFGITQHGSPAHRYCVVSKDGKILKSTASGQMNSPFGFVVSKGGTKVFVADHGNNRMLLLNSDSLSIEQLPAAFSVGFSNPYCIHFDASAGVMYVGEWGGGRIMCFKK